MSPEVVRAYADAAAFRRALEDRLRRRRDETGLPLDRMRKEVAAQRFLARLAQAGPADGWVLKGSLAIIAMVGEHARATRDADIT